jgi:hypothetical protein
MHHQLESRARRLLPLLLSCGLAAGCVHVEQKLTLRADGSGDFDVRYGMARKDVDQMEEMSRRAMAMEGLTNGAESSSPFDFNEEDIRKDFKEYEPLGVKLTAVRISETNDWKYVDLSIHFDSLRGLSKTQFIADRDISLTRRADGRYEFRQAAPASAMSPAEMAGMDEAGIRSLMAEMMKGFRARMQVETPGAIVETSADSHEERTAAWEFDLDKDPQALDRAQKVDLSVVFEGQGLALPEFKSSSDGI